MPSLPKNKEYRTWSFTRLRFILPAGRFNQNMHKRTIDFNAFFEICVSDLNSRIFPVQHIIGRILTSLVPGCSRNQTTFPEKQKSDVFGRFYLNGASFFFHFDHLKKCCCAESFDLPFWIGSQAGPDHG